MIVRMWHGRVPSNKAQAYREFLIRRAIPDYRSVAANISVQILERADVEAAKYYPEDRELLLEFEPRVVHYKIAGSS
jgi:hypothetical protein